ncbi:MAG: winged helix DNA-binding domain-containing protein, partial [Chloroflexi bacterium]|nr:winged helix DNA-binding domain-containing protein [Chloroflexota bacterium]
SLWARVPGFQREMLDDALYEQRTLAKVLCMRMTLHLVPSDEAPFFVQIGRNLSERRTPPRFRGGGLLVYAGLCQEEEASVLLEVLYRRVLDVLADRGPATLPEISPAVPELTAKIQHSEGKAYEGEFSIGTRLMGEWCARGLLIRTRPRGTWRSNLYEYAAFSDWLPDTDLSSVTLQDAQAWLVRRYLAAFGPATLDDVQWWTGLTKTETRNALKPLGPELAEVSIAGLGDAQAYLMLTDDAERLSDFTPPGEPFVFFLPALDPYIMGYKDRRRFLDPAHNDKVFDRAGNAVPTVWANGRVVGVWNQRDDGSVVYGLFEPVSEPEQALLDAEARRLEGFLGGDVVAPPFFRTAFFRDLK